MPIDYSSYLSLPDFSTEQQKEIDRHFLGIPYSLPAVSNNGFVQGLYPLEEGIRRGVKELYNRQIMQDSRFLQDANGDWYRLDPEVTNLNLSSYTEYPYREFRRVLPVRDFIGGAPDEARLKVANRIPGLHDGILKRASSYDVDPSLMFHRVNKEGFLDQLANEWNDLDAAEQVQEWWQDIPSRPVYGYGALGLDYAGDELMQGKYSLKDPNAEWEDGGRREDDEGGRHRVMEHTVRAKNLESALEIMAAAMDFRRKEVQRRYHPSDEDLWKYVNASYNSGLYSPIMKNPDAIRREYTYDDYYGNVKSQGGNINKVKSLYDRITNSGYQLEYGKGGKIHIKPSHRGRLTELKARTGKTEAELYNDGNPAQKRMVVFARNARKWKH